MLASQNPEQLLDKALSALSTGEQCLSMLDELPVPIYATDSNGMVTYWNRACVDFAGREPELGRDRWHIVERLYTAMGETIPANECPMAHAIREKRRIRDTILIAERPDGTRCAFRSYPTPMFDRDDCLAGAVNLLVDVTEEQSEVLAEQAKRCRRLADALYSRESATVLSTMAERFERTAANLRAHKDC